MVQEIGETVDAMVQDDEKEIQRILSGYKHDHYWIVIHHKPTKQRLTSGEMVIKKVIQPYTSKPDALIGTIILEVKDGEIVNEQVNVHDAPIDWFAIGGKIGSETNPQVQQRRDINGAYLYNV